MRLRVLVGCEYSQTVTKAFRALGHEAFSCDYLPTDGDPDWHYQEDVLRVLAREKFDLAIFHPPCTYLTTAAEWAYRDAQTKRMRLGVLFGEARRKARVEALRFIDALWSAEIPHICIENPVGVIPTARPGMPKPQYIQPWWFGDDASKKTGLWLKNLPNLVPTSKMPGDSKTRRANQSPSGQNNVPDKAGRWKIRSKTYQGIADAMASQFSACISLGDI